MNGTYTYAASVLTRSGRKLGGTAACAHGAPTGENY